MKITLGKLIDAANSGESIEGINPQIISAIGAAYWAGQSNARAAERQANRDAIAKSPSSRYHKLVSRICDLFSSNAVEGLKSEVAEFRTWDFEII